MTACHGNIARKNCDLSPKCGWHRLASSEIPNPISHSVHEANGFELGFKFGRSLNYRCHRHELKARRGQVVQTANRNISSCRKRCRLRTCPDTSGQDAESRRPDAESRLSDTGLGVRGVSKPKKGAGLIRTVVFQTDPSLSLAASSREAVDAWILEHTESLQARRHPTTHHPTPSHRSAAGTTWLHPHASLKHHKHQEAAS